jgi:hypothetical protein
MLIKDETKATAHAMPDEVVGFTDILDEPLKRILLYNKYLLLISTLVLLIMNEKYSQ